MNNISGIYVIHFLLVQCLSNVMRSGLTEYNTNFRVLYLKLIMHIRRCVGEVCGRQQTKPF